MIWHSWHVRFMTIYGPSRVSMCQRGKKTSVLIVCRKTIYSRLCMYIDGGLPLKVIQFFIVIRSNSIYSNSMVNIHLGPDIVSCVDLIGSHPGNLWCISPKLTLIHDRTKDRYYSKHHLWGGLSLSFQGWKAQKLICWWFRNPAKWPMDA